MSVTLRPFRAEDLPLLDAWASAIGLEAYLHRRRPRVEAATGHAPERGLFWYVILVAGAEAGTLWLEPDEDGMRLSIFLGDPQRYGQGIGRAAIHLAVSDVQAVHPGVPIHLNVRTSNARAIACYRRAGFSLVEEAVKTTPAGEVIPYCRMTLPGV